MNIKISPYGDLELTDVKVEDLPRIEAFYSHVREQCTMALLEYDASLLNENHPTIEEDEE